MKKTRALAITLIISLLAIWSLRNLSFGNDSIVAQNSFFVTIKHFGRDPGEIERTITIPLEQSLQNVRGLETIRSRSEYGSSRIELQMKHDYVYAESFLDVYDTVQKFHAGLPDTVQKPEIYSGTNSDRPAMIVKLEGDPRYLQSYAESTLKSLLEQVEEAGEIQVGGARKSEVHITLRQGIASAFGISPQTVSAVLQQQHLVRSAGTIETSDKRVPLLYDAALSELADFEAITVPSNQGGRIPLGSIAQVTLGEREHETISRINGDSSIVLYIKPSGRGSSIDLSRGILKVLDSEMPLSYEIILDEGADLQISINDLIASILVTMAVVSVVLTIGLKKFSPGLLVSLTLPFYSLLTLSILSAAGLTIGISTLLGIGLAVGAVADSGIIIVSRKDSKKPQLGSSLVLSLAAAALTTVIVTLPIISSESLPINVQRIALSFFIFILVSTVLNIYLLPSFAAQTESGETTNIRPPRPNKYTEFATGLIHKSAPPIVAISIALGAMSVILVLVIPKKLDSARPDEVVSVHVELPSGSSIISVDSALQVLRTHVHTHPAVKQVETLSRRENGSMRVKFDEKIASYAEISAFVEQSGELLSGGFVMVDSVEEARFPIRIGIHGPDPEKLHTIVSSVSDRLGSEPWVSGIVYHFKDGGPVWTYLVDREKISSIRTSPQAVVEALHWRLQGPVVLKWLDGDEERDIRIMEVDKSEVGIDDLLQTTIQLENGRAALRDLGSFVLADDNKPVFRENHQRVLELSVYTGEQDISMLTSRIDQVMKTAGMPAGYHYTISKELLEKRAEVEELLIAFLLSVVLVFMCLAAGFESLRVPMVILASIPVSLVLPLAIILIVSIDFTSYALIGFVIVSGMVVNNGILIAEGARQAEGSKSMRVEEGTRARMKGIVLTTASTCLGFLPLLIGIGGVPNQIRILSLVMLLGVLGAFFCGTLVLPRLLAAFIPENAGENK